MEYVLANSTKVIMQVKDGNNLMYIPLDKLMENKGRGRQPVGDEVSGATNQTAPMEVPRGRAASRQGGTR